MANCRFGGIRSLGANDMSVLITALIVAMVVFYLRSNRKARLKWLQDLALTGQWVSQRNGASLSLSGKMDAGEFFWRGDAVKDSGQWLYQGSTLTLNGQHQRSFTVQLYQPGVISLMAKDGTAELFHKQSTNVVPLAKR